MLVASVFYNSGGGRQGLRNDELENRSRLYQIYQHSHRSSVRGVFLLASQMLGRGPGDIRVVISSGSSHCLMKLDLAPVFSTVAKRCIQV